MDIKDYYDMLPKCISLIRSVTKDSSTYRQAVDSLHNLEKNYGTTIPVEHQPIDTEQHRENFLKYNPQATSVRESIVLYTALSALTLGIAVGGIIFRALSQIGIGLFIAALAGIIALYKKNKLERKTGFWLAAHPLEDCEIWHIADYWE